MRRRGDIVRPLTPLQEGPSHIIGDFGLADAALCLARPRGHDSFLHPYASQAFQSPGRCIFILSLWTSISDRGIDPANQGTKKYSTAGPRHDLPVVLFLSKITLRAINYLNSPIPALCVVWSAGYGDTGHIMLFNFVWPLKIWKCTYQQDKILPL
jgi:hypothetical protein